VQRDDERAHELDLLAAESGIAASQMRLGYAAMYPQKSGRARSRRSCSVAQGPPPSRDHPMALYLLGQLYF
jgi:hypothetical protein